MAKYFATIVVGRDQEFKLVNATFQATRQIEGQISVLAWLHGCLDLPYPVEHKQSEIKSSLHNSTTTQEHKYQQNGHSEEVSSRYYSQVPQSA